MTNVFVYGSLKKGGWLHYLLEKSEYLGQAKTKRGLFILRDCGNFPCITLNSGKSKSVIYGEVYAVNDEVLHRLDSVESEGRMYSRQVQTVEMSEGDDLEVHLYIGIMEAFQKLPVVKSGNWNVSKGRTAVR